VLVVDDSRSPTGFAVFRVAADEAELLTIAVDPDRRRMGVGRRLLAEGLAQVAERGACRVFLEVGEHNLAARRLYEGHGFAVVSERRGYYDGPDPQTALICLRSL
jgi:ribosomal-protein-alanine N-acetyltransferase